MTPSAKMTNQIDESIKEERLKILQDLLSQQELKFNKSKENTEIEVLIESLSNKIDGSFFGKSQYLQTTIITSQKKNLIGQKT